MNMMKIIALAIILLLTGCSDSDLKKENTALKVKLNNVNKYNTQLEMKIQRLNYLEKEVNNVKQNNKNLSVTLAKSELLFSKKYKEEVKKEEVRLKNERIKIENNAKLLAEKNAKNKYMIIIGSLIIFFLAFIVFAFFKRNEYTKKTLDKEEESNKSNERISKLNIIVEEQEKAINSLKFKLKDMETKAKENSINQVIREIDEHQSDRDKALRRIEKELPNEF